MQPVEFLYVPLVLVVVAIPVVLIALGIKKAKASTHTWKRG